LSTEVKALKSIEIGDGYILYVTEEKRNPLIRRLEVYGYVDHIGKGAPSRKNVREALSKLYGKPDNLIIVRKLISEFGWGKTRFEVHIYDDEKRLLKFEPKYILKRNGLLKEKKEGE